MPDYLLRKTSGELEVVAGNEPFTVTPQNGIGTYAVYRLDNSAAVTLSSNDTTAPLLSGVMGSLTGDTATLNWLTDEGNGTAFWVLSTSATVPTVANILSGQDHTGETAFASGIQTVTTAGLQSPQSIAGLANGVTYFFHLVQQDASGNTSSIYSTSGVVVSGASVSISVRERSILGVAPEGFLFDVALTGFDTPLPAVPMTTGTGDYNRRYHELYYSWDFGEGYQYTAPNNIQSADRDSRFGNGPIGSHVYRDDGTFTVTCTVFEPASGKSATGTLDVTIGNLATEHPGSRTVFVDTTGSGVGAPSGAIIETSLNAAIARAENQSLSHRIVLKDGQTFSLNYGEVGRYHPSISIVAEYAGGPKPVVNVTQGFFWNDTKVPAGTRNRDFRIQGIDFYGPWDSTTESGTGNVNLWAAIGNPPVQIVFDDVLMDGFGIAVQASFSGNPVLQGDQKTFLNDSVITNWRDYGIFDSRNEGFSILGSAVRQNPMALSGGPKDGAHNNHGPYRNANSGITIVQSSEFFSRNGWFVNGGYQDQQPCIRWDTTGRGGGFYHLSRSYLEGGTAVIANGVQAGDSNRAINGIIERCYLCGTHQARKLAAFSKAGMSVRNNIGVFTHPTGGELASTYRPSEFLDVEWDGINAGEEVDPINIYNNTWVNHSGDVNVTDLLTNGFTNVNYANNVVHEPNASPSQDSFGPLDATPLYTPYELGYIDENNTTLLTQYATLPGQVSSFAPLSGSSAIGAADTAEPTLFAYDDFFGNTRPVYPSQGALEMP